MFFVAGRPRAALLLWFFGGFGCGALLFVVIRVVCGCKNRWRWLLSVGLAGGRLLGSCCSPGCRLWCLWLCLFVLSFFPRGVLDEILNLIESVSEEFPSYSYAYAEPRVEISTQDGRTGYLSLILYLREETNLLHL